MLPSAFIDLTTEEKAVVMAFIDEKVKEEKKQQDKAKAKRVRRR